MMLDFGWKERETRESIWINDPALEGVPETVEDAWREDGDASHLRPYVKNGKATIIEFRTLTPDETRFVMGKLSLEDTRAAMAAFRIGVSFPGMKHVQTPDGASHDLYVNERGIRMIASEATAAFDQAYPGIVEFYGMMILQSSFASDDEKKASSQRSTKPKSSNGTGDQTGKPAAATGATDAPNPSTPECAAPGDALIWELDNTAKGG